MGNVSGYFERDTIQKDVIQHPPKLDLSQICENLDDITMEQALDYLIKKGKLKNLDTDNMKNISKNINFTSKKLLPISIEFYEKLEGILPEQILQNNKIKTFKKNDYKPPKFEKEAVKMVVLLAEYPDPIELFVVEPPKHKLDDRKINYCEFMECFNENKPNKKGLFGLTNNMVKNCSNFHKTQFINSYNRLLSGAEDASTIGKVVYKHKKGPLENIKSFRPIVMLPLLVKHFHRIISIRLVEYLKKNNYLDTTISKGCIKGVKDGCPLQIVKVKEAIKDANKSGKPLCLLFLDISNAYGNLHLKKLYEIMRHYHIDENFISYVKNFYDNLRYYSQTTQWNTDALRWENGIIQGSPLSPILFVLCMNYVLTYLDGKYRDDYGYTYTNSKDSLNPAKILFTAYVDDVCILCNSMDSLREIYSKIVILFEMLGLPLNQSKCAIMKINCQSETKMDINVVKQYTYLGKVLTDIGDELESFSSFLKRLAKEMADIDKMNVDKGTKMTYFMKHKLSWIRKNTQMFYDITNNDRRKIIAIVKQYFQKWGYREYIELIGFVGDLFDKVSDEVISNIEIELEDVKEDIELSNYLVNNNETIHYDDIKKMVTPVLQ